IVTVGIYLKNVDPVLDRRRDILVKKFERTDTQCKQRQAFQEFEGGDQTQATAVGSSFSHFFRPRLYLKKQAYPAVCGERGISFRTSAPVGVGFLAPFLQLRPNIGQRPEFCAAANKDRDR